MLKLILLTTWLGTYSDSLTSWIASQPFPVVASIRRIHDQQEVYQFRGDQWISPASTWKIFAVATAQKQLGSSFRFQTHLSHSGQIDNHVLRGDLIVTPSGDPTFGSRRLFSAEDDPVRQLVKTLKSLGIQRIEGQIRLNNLPVYPQIPNSWTWGDIGNHYGAFPQPFNYQENQFSVYFTAGTSLGAPVQIDLIQPFDSSWRIQNLVTTGPASSGDQVMIYSAPGSSNFIFTGTVPLRSTRFRVRGSLHHPWEIFRESIRKALKEADILWIEAKSETKLPEKILHTWTSPTLETIGKRCLTESVNLYADALIQRVAGTSASWEQVKASLIPLWSPFPTTFWEDGSGLSPMNLVQPSAYSLFLAQIPPTEQPLQWISWLPELGKSGTVRSFQPTEVPIFVKSGTIQYVRTYAGYFQAQDGQWYAFFVGSYPVKPDQGGQARQFFQSFFKKLPLFI